MTKIKNKTKRQKQNKTNVAFVLCWPTTPGYVAYPVVWLTVHWKKRIVALPLRSIANSSLKTANNLWL